MVSKSDQIRALRERRFAEPAKPEPVRNAIKLSVTHKADNTNASRQARWRAAHLEISRERTRERMRKRRAAAKEPTS